MHVAARPRLPARNRQVLVRAALVPLLLLVTACAAGDPSATTSSAAGDGTPTTAVEPEAPHGSSTTGGDHTAGGTTVATTTTVATAGATTSVAGIEAILDARPLAVAHEQRTYIDDTRATRAYDVLPASEVRTLVTELWYPTDTPGAVPLIVFSHGIAGHPDKFTELFEAWAAAGYAVAAPAFPLTSVGASRGMGGNDLANQPADVSFVLDSVLAEAAAGGVLADVIDPERIGVAGMSLGGMTTYAVAFGDAHRDDRFDAAIVMASTPDTPDGPPDLTSGLPLLIVHGGADRIFAIDAPLRAYDAAVAPRALVVLDGQGHFQAFEDAPSSVDEEVRSLTVAWWDRWLGGDPTGIDRLAEVVDRNATLSMQSDLG